VGEPRGSRRCRRGWLPALAAVSLSASLVYPVFATVNPPGSGSLLPEESRASLVLAYYYIWYTSGSWTRAKTDLPLLGPYNSSDPRVIAQHIAWAKQAGIDGFIVSWKHEPRLDDPLKTLVQEARRQNFKLVLLYESLDVSRNPIGAQRVAADLEWLEATYGKDPVFDVFGVPAVVWSGSQKYSASDVAAVRSAIKAPDQLLLLGSERSAADYLARQHLLDGDAYYWSSADPMNTPGYQRRLDDLGRAVTSSHGRWIAPIAPGFDARLVGGTSVVPRRDGDTYRASWAAAEVENPSALGIISWNELSGKPSLGPVIQSLPTAPLDVATGGTDSSELPANISSSQQLLSLLVSLGLLGLLGLHAVRVRRRIA